MDNIYGRISDELYNQLASLDDLIIKMGTTSDNEKLSDVGEPYEFKIKLEQYKDFLKTELSEFSIEEILKIDKYFNKLNLIYSWYNSFLYLKAIEYEHRKKYDKDVVNCFICLNCKSFWAMPIAKCDCGCSSFAPTHKDNYNFIKNKEK